MATKPAVARSEESGRRRDDGLGRLDLDETD
jgi:hypothetical protein